MQHAGLLLPSELHKVVTAKDLLPGRLLVVGDIHGCLHELQDLLQKIKYVQGQDNLVFVGDLGDKGPFSIEVRGESFLGESFLRS